MNTYGKFAQDTWKMLAPTQYALIPDPEDWFTALGKEAETAVVNLMMQLEGPDIKGETYLEKVGRINAAKMQAEEIVRAEILTPQPEDLEDDEEEDEEEDEEDSTAILLKFRQDMNRIMQEGMEELNREEMERGLND